MTEASNHIVSLGGEVSGGRLVGGPIEAETHEAHHPDEHAVKLVEAVVAPQQAMGRLVKAHPRAMHQMADDQHELH